MDLRPYSHLTSFMIGQYNTTMQHVFNRGPKMQCVEMAGGYGGNWSTEAHRLVHVPRTHPMFQGQSVLCAVSKVCSPVLNPTERMTDSTPSDWENRSSLRRSA